MNNNKETLKEQEVAENSAPERKHRPTIEGYVFIEDDGKRHWPDPPDVQLELVPVDLQEQHRAAIKASWAKSVSPEARARHRAKRWRGR
jgi:hypothetical protein